MKSTLTPRHGSENLLNLEPSCPEPSMSGVLQTSPQVTCAALLAATSLLASPAGSLPCNSPDGPKTGPSGRVRRRASPSVLPAKDGEPTMSGTCGRSSCDSSASAALCNALGSRLKTLCGTDGLMEYQQTWKAKVTPAGRQFWGHTARGRLTSDKDFTGWPTPRANNMTGAGTRGEGGENLQTAGLTAGWPTPQARDVTGRSLGQKEIHGTKHGCSCLVRTAQTAGWPTASARDWKDTAGMSTTGVNPDGSQRTRLDQLPRVATLVTGWPTSRATDGTKSVRTEAGAMKELERKGGPQDLDCAAQITGAMPSGSPAAMESTAGFQLSPAFSLYLMGYPIEWHRAGVSALRSLKERATQSSRKPRPSSSKHS